MVKTSGGCSRRERLEVAAAALIPAGLGLLGPAILLAGRLSWLGPLLALPVGLCLGPVWRRLGERDLPAGLRAAFGRVGGKAAALLYFLWALALLADAARRYSERLLTISEGEGVRWFFLVTALALCLWLGRGDGAVLARSGQLFAMAVLATLGGALLLSLPGVDWMNLWPPEGTEWQGLPGSGALCLSLTGYGIYVLCLPRQRERDGGKTWPWAAWGCGLYAALLFIVVGTFGPALAGRMGEPFLYLLEGVQVPGAFQRGEAGLVALLTLADLALLTVLSRGSMALWRELAPPFSGAGCLPVGAAFALAGVLPGLGRAWGWLAAILPRGNLLLGVLLPVFAVLTIRFRESQKSWTTFCGEERKEEADVAVKPGDKKSNEENEKKC